MENDVEYYVRSGFEFAKEFLKDFFGKTSVSISIDENDFLNRLNEVKRLSKNFLENRVRAYMREDDLKIRINKMVLEKEFKNYSIPIKDFYYNWSAYITSYFYPYTFFLEYTNSGKELRERLSKIYSTGIIEEESLRKVENLRRLFSGMGFWAELKISEHLPYRNIFLEKIRVKDDERIGELDESNGFKFCNMLEKKARESFLDNFKRRAIIAEAIKYIDKEGEDFSFGLEKLMIKIDKGKMNIEEIFSGVKLFVVEPQVKEVKDSLFELTKDILTRNWSIVKRKMENLCEKLEEIGEVDLYENGLEIISAIDKEFGEEKGFEKGKMYIEDLLNNPARRPIYFGLREWLMEVEEFCEKVGKYLLK